VPSNQEKASRALRRELAFAGGGAALEVAAHPRATLVDRAGERPGRAIERKSRASANARREVREAHERLVFFEDHESLGVVSEARVVVPGHARMMR
jgi:hypothetical protein